MPEKYRSTSEPDAESLQSRTMQKQPAEGMAVRISESGISNFSREEQFIRRYVASALVTAALGIVVLPVAIPLAMVLHDRANYPWLILGAAIALIDFSLVFFLLWEPTMRMHDKILRINRRPADMTRGVLYRTIFGWGLFFSGIYNGFASLFLRIPDEFKVMTVVACAAGVIFGILLLMDVRRRKR